MIDAANPDILPDGLINFDKKRKEFEVLAQVFKFLFKFIIFWFIDLNIFIYFFIRLNFFKELLTRITYLLIQRLISGFTLF